MNNARLSPVRALADQAFSRAAGAPLIAGNGVRLLKNAEENYPAWLDAINSAEKWIHFESYIIHEDSEGRKFAEAMKRKAREGVKVRLIYDWMGGLTATSNRFWRELREAGVEVRCFNRFNLESPFGWLTRDHRKMLGVDGRVGFVSGLCVGCYWVGDKEKCIEPWRDTGVEVRGPAVAEIEQAFAQIWASMGEELPAEEVPTGDLIRPAGDVALRVVGSQPNMAGMYRLDQLVTAVARRSLWLTDAYFLGTTPYVQALAAAAKDGVDVRLLVPRSSDLAIVSALGRAGYRSLLESGVRVFEWNGPMLHAKTAVADGRWARVGSTNLNIASWMGNWELDVVVEDERFGREMEKMYLEDLGNATEILLNERNRVRLAARRVKQRGRGRVASGSARGVAAGALRIGNAVGAAITNHRLLGAAEARLMGSASLLLAALSAMAIKWPRSIAMPFAVIGIWTAISLLVRAWKLHRKHRREFDSQARELPQPKPQRARERQVLTK
jgi:cardiolipin synthase A/B